MTLDERIAEAEREMAEAWDDMQLASAEIDAIYATRVRPAVSRRWGWAKELERLRALKSGDAAEGE